MNSTKPGRGSEIPVAEAVGWKELVSYQSGSVVSRVLLSRETGNVTLFAFDEVGCGKSRRGVQKAHLGR